MNHTVRALALHRDIAAPQEGRAADGTVAILVYRSLVAKGNLEPAQAEHLARVEDAKEPVTIRAGRYLFTQGLLRLGERAARDPERAESEPEWRDAAEAVWLESLWRNRAFASDRFYVRILTEDGKTVFQVFREIEADD